MSPAFLQDYLVAARWIQWLKLVVCATEPASECCVRFQVVPVAGDSALLFQCWRLRLKDFVHEVVPGTLCLPCGDVFLSSTCRSCKFPYPCGRRFNEDMMAIMLLVELYDATNQTSMKRLLRAFPTTRVTWPCSAWWIQDACRGAGCIKFEQRELLHRLLFKAVHGVQQWLLTVTQVS